MAKQKYYVVWEGVTPGIYTSWTDCQLQTKGVEGAKFKSFETLAEAESAFASSPYVYIGKNASKVKPNVMNNPNSTFGYPSEVIENAIAVDAACSGNPGMMEYRGVHVLSHQELFKFGPVYGTNNIGEFLAIVHCLAYQEKSRFELPIYTDSVNAMSWVKQKKCKTKLERNTKTEELFRIIERAEIWLKTHSFRVPIFKWDTKQWGEIPADFGRK